MPIIKDTSKKRAPRGIRNNNPLNIRISNNAWLGKVEHNTDGAFEQFITMQMGIRAAVKQIFTYIRRGDDTPTKVINRWAPPSENNTAAYIERVCALAQLAPHQRLERKSRNFICRMLWAMAQVECGRTIDIQEFFDAYDLAIV